MKVTLINTADAGGGAPVACMRLLKALKAQQIDARLLVQEQKTTEPGVAAVNKSYIGKIKNAFNFFYERLPFIWLQAKNRSLRFAFSTADAGTDISKHTLIVDADVLHLHWTNSGYLSINDLKALLRTGKPIVWTLHDMWAFTGGCHYAGECNHFVNECGNCWMLRNPDSHDLSFKGWIRKNNMLGFANNIVFVTCSHWLADVARTSSLLKKFKIETIPNPIDTDIFLPKEKSAARVKWGIDTELKIILFGAANILDRRKGITYLVEALTILKDSYNDLDDIGVVIFGKNKSFDVTTLPFKVFEMDVIRSEKDMAELYNVADVFVTPAIEDNLPNTVMEALSCGTPVVAFNTGGIPDMVVHQQNGYLAEYKSAEDFATGIYYVLTSENIGELKACAREKVLTAFTNELIADKYLAVYQSLIPA